MVRLIILIYFVVGFRASLRAEVGTCNANKGLVDIHSFAREVLQPIHIQNAGDLNQDWCDRELKIRYLNSYSPKVPQFMNHMNSESIAKASLKNQIDRMVADRAYRDDNTAWGLSLVPDKAAINRSVQKGVLLPDSPSFDWKDDNRAGALAQLEAAEKVIDANPCSFKKPWIRNPFNTNPKTFSEVTGSSGFLNDYIQNTDRFNNICEMQVGTDKAQVCSATVKGVIKDMSPGIYGRVLGSVPQFYDRFLNTSDYDQGLKIAAKKLIGHYRAGSAPSKSNLFDDLKSSFIETGVSPAKSESLTWETLALISSAGPNMGHRLEAIKFEPNRWPAIAAITSIATLAPALDFASKKPHLYSYPPNITTSCDNRKAYHFWMAAYLARNAALNGADPNMAATATFIANQGYQMGAGSEAFRGKTGQLLAYRPFAAAVNIVRADSAFAAAGAVHGVNSAYGKTDTPLNINDGIRAAMKNSNAQTEMTSEQIDQTFKNPMAGYRRWAEMTGTPATMSVYQTQVPSQSLQRLPATETRERSPLPQCP